MTQTETRILTTARNIAAAFVILLMMIAICGTGPQYYPTSDMVDMEARP